MVLEGKEEAVLFQSDMSSAFYLFKLPLNGRDSFALVFHLLENNWGLVVEERGYFWHATLFLWVGPVL